MTSTVSKITEGKYRVEIDLSDETKSGVALAADTTVLGDEAAARRYAQTFAQDIRDNNRDKFPEPVIPQTEELI